MFVYRLLSLAFFHVEIWGPQELLLQYMRPNSYGFAYLYAGGVPHSGRSVTMCRVLEGLVGGGIGKFRYRHI